MFDTIDTTFGKLRPGLEPRRGKRQLLRGKELEGTTTITSLGTAGNSCNVAEITRYTGCVAVVEMYPEDYVPDAKILAFRRLYTKHLLKTSKCHTIFVRMGCYIGIFRDTEMAGKLPYNTLEDPVTHERSDAWYAHPKGFLLLWGTKEVPVTYLPCVPAGRPWPVYRETLLDLLKGGNKE